MIAHQYSGGLPPSFGFPPNMHGGNMMPSTAHYAPHLDFSAQMRYSHSRSTVPSLPIPMHHNVAPSHHHQLQGFQTRQLKNEHPISNGFHGQAQQYPVMYQQQYQAHQQQQPLLRGDNGQGHPLSVYNDNPEAGGMALGHNTPDANSTPAQGYSFSSLNEERAHLDRLFSALAAGHPHAHTQGNIHPQVLQHHVASHGPVNHPQQSNVRAMVHPYAGSRLNSSEQQQHLNRQVQAQQQQLWASAGHPQLHQHGYGQASQLTMAPSLPLPHQGTGLQPAFDFGSTFSRSGEIDEKAVGASLMPVSNNRYNEVLLEQERRALAVAQAQQLQEQEIQAAAAWADYAVQQQHHRVQTSHPSHPQNEMSLVQQQQMELSEVVLPGKEITLDDEPELIPKDASAIPPPPTIEKSAYPLAALATDLVWDAFISASSSSSSASGGPTGGALSGSSGNSPSMTCGSSGSQSPMFRSESESRARGGSLSPFTGFGGNISTHLGGANYISSSSTYPRTPASSIGTKKSHLRTTPKSLSPPSNQRNGERATSIPRDVVAPGDSGYSTPVGNVYGAIGGERRPARQDSNINNKNENNSPQSSSSPASSTPGTPESHSGMSNNNCIVKTASDSSLGAKIGSKRLSSSHPASKASSGMTWLSQGEEISLESFSNANKDIYSAGLLRNPLQQQQRLVNHLAPPTALFEQIQKLLGATLLSQQVLLLALYFVAKTPHTCPLYPPATSQSALKSTSAPFKLLLAALVVANKHLDDNSFRNSTFAQVANVTLPEVNALEFSMLSSLEFDINVLSSDWLAWLRDLQYQRTTRFSSSTATTVTGEQGQVVSVASVVTPLISGVLAHQEEHARVFNSPIGSSTPEMERSDSVQDDTPYKSSIKSEKLTRSSPLMTGDDLAPFQSGDDGERGSPCFDMDAAGPLEVEQRPRYNKAFGAAPISPSYKSTKKIGYLDNFQMDGEAMFTTHASMEEEEHENAALRYGAHDDDWDMPEDPYSLRVPF